MRLFAYILLGLVGLLFVTAGIILLYDIISDSYRRRKYPEYFNKFNRAIENGSRLTTYFEENIKPFTIIIERTNKAHKDGVISDEDFMSVTNIITNAFDVYQDTYQEMSQELKDLWQEVHQYALDNHLKWGEVY